MRDMSRDINSQNPPPIFSHRLTQDISQTKKFYLSVFACVGLWLNRQSFDNFDGGFGITFQVEKNKKLC